MIICCCFGTTDRELREAYAQGRLHECPAGRGCGSCLRTVRHLVAHARRTAHTDERTPDDPDTQGTLQRAG